MDLFNNMTKFLTSLRAISLCLFIIFKETNSSGEGMFIRTLERHISAKLLEESQNSTESLRLLDDISTYQQSLIALLKKVKLRRTDVKTDVEHLYGRELPWFLQNSTVADCVNRKFNLTEYQAARLSYFFDRIKNLWNEFNDACKLDSQIVSRTGYPKFNNLDKLDERLAQMFQNPHPHYVALMFRDLSSYYYNFGKFLRMFMFGRTDVINKAKHMYAMGKPLFLKNRIDVRQLEYLLQLSYVEASDLSMWISVISKRWKYFKKFYERNIGYLNKPNYTNVYLLQNLDGKLAEQLNRPTLTTGSQFMNDTTAFLQTLGLLLRRNYDEREECIEKAREHYRRELPEFMRHGFHIEELQKSLRLSDAEFFKLKSNILRIKLKWRVLIGLDPDIHA